jgi:hypothetical protein
LAADVSEPPSPLQHSVEQTVEVVQPDPIRDINDQRMSLTASDKLSITTPCTFAEHMLIKPRKPEVEAENDDDDEAIWKKMMDIEESESSNASIVVVRSSSPHITQPTNASSSIMASLQRLRRGTKHAHPVSEVFAPAQQREVHAPDTVPAHPDQSQHLIVAPEDDQGDPNSDENDYWRRFVLGGTSTQEDSSLAGTKPQTTSESQDILPLFAQCSQHEIEDMRSDRATIAESVYADKARRETVTHNEINTSSSQGFTNVSMIGHAATTVADVEDIEDEEEEVATQKARRYTRPSGHAAPKLDPKRFKQSRKRAPYPPLPRAVPRLLPAVTTTVTSTARTGHNASDGLSF